MDLTLLAFSTGGFLSASVDPPFKESTDDGLSDDEVHALYVCTCAQFEVYVMQMLCTPCLKIENADV